MGRKIKDLSECKHPNSRKTKALAKQLKKESNRERKKLANAIKANILGDKILWFRDHLKEIFERESTQSCTHSHLKTLIETYLARFNDELEQIKLKRSIGMRKNSRQHASREDIINMTIQRESNEYETCGLEIPDFLNVANAQTILNWNGELRFIQKLKLKRFTKTMLESQR